MANASPVAQIACRPDPGLQLELWSPRFKSWVEAIDIMDVHDGAVLRLSQPLCDDEGLTSYQRSLRHWLTQHHLEAYFMDLRDRGYDDVAAVCGLEAGTLQEMGWPPGHRTRLERVQQMHKVRP